MLMSPVPSRPIMPTSGANWEKNALNGKNRPSSSFVNKFWPLQMTAHQQQQLHHQQHQQHSATASNGKLNVPHTHSKTLAFSSSVAVQKLRESKWFKRDEARIFCAVIECGFIVELRSNPALAQNNNSRSNRSSFDDRDGHNHNNSRLTTSEDDDDDDDEDDENATTQQSSFGIVLCKSAKDNKTKPETIEIYSVKIRENGTFKMMKMTLDDVWNKGLELRINNFDDREKQPHNDKDIREQVSFARKAKQSLWSNNKNFVHWCRYGSRQQDVRKRHMSECARWGSVGMNAGMLLIMNKQK